MIQFVGNNGILRAKKRFEKAAVGIETGAVENGILGAEECAQLVLQFLVDALRAADKPHRRKSITPAVERFAGRFDHRGVLGQTEVVVGAQVQHRLAVTHPDVRVLRTGDDPLPLVSAGGPDLLKLREQMVLHRTEHSLKLAG